MFRWLRDMLGDSDESRLIGALRAEQAARYDEMRAERNYWRTRCEQLLDAALFQRNEIRHHVFSEPPAAPAEKAQQTTPLMRALGALAHNEIESVPPPTKVER